MTEARTSWTFTPVDQPEADPIVGSAPTNDIPRPQPGNKHQLGLFVITPRVADDDLAEVLKVLDYEVDMLSLGSPIELPIGSVWDLLVEEGSFSTAMRIAVLPDRVVTVYAPNPLGDGRACHFMVVRRPDAP